MSRRAARSCSRPSSSPTGLFAPAEIKCWPAGTGRALADWLRSRGIEPQWMELPPGKRATEVDVD